MYESQIAEIKAQEAKLYELAGKPSSDFAPIYFFSEDDKNKTNDQHKQEAIEVEKEYYNKLLRNLGKLVAFGPENNLAI